MALGESERESERERASESEREKKRKQKDGQTRRAVGRREAEKTAKQTDRRNSVIEFRLATA